MSDEPNGPNYALVDELGLARGLFYPRRDRSPPPRGATDHRVRVEEGVEVACRFHPIDRTRPAVLLFHGNGEIASDYDAIAPLYHEIGVNLLVADYRGYGGSGGVPSFASLIADAHPVLAHFHALLDGEGFAASRFVMGRSLGSLPAAELAATAHQRLAGLVIESGAPDLDRLRRRVVISGPDAEITDLVLAHARRVAPIPLPVVQIHGEWDQIIPLEHGVAFHEQLLTDRKQLVIIPGAGHNDIGWVGRELYFETLARFLGGTRGDEG
jgi:alpha-beta hydrolase superfamily lysophospholipase